MSYADLRCRKPDGSRFLIQKYPSLCDVATRMAMDNGCINREEPVTKFYETCDTVLADKDDTDLFRLTVWLGTLSEEEMNTLADGEETEMNELRTRGPKGGPDLVPLANILDDIFEVM